MQELTERLRSHIEVISRDRDPFFATQGHFYVQQYIREQFSHWGTVEYQAFQVGKRTHYNWILNLAGRENRKPPILIGAHYDAVPNSPGADDNATGVAVLLEMAKAFSEQSARYPIRLVAFDLEENFTQTDTHGNSQYAMSLNGEPLRLMIALEMLGYCNHDRNSQLYPAGLERFYPDQGNFIALIGNIPTIPDLMRLSREIRRSNIGCEWLPAGMRGKIVPDTRRGDHAAFWDRGYRALMVTDTANLRNPNYHKPSDRIETLDFDFLTKVCEGLIHSIRQL
ncbi:M28 family peptidase [Leptolyngbya sp. NIES-2104]|uniref:M28 family peptidase n=1 Tax=Leptolyngbya sp. NIES-2104 TaxID=1552121 RepID=UPI0006ECB4BB|nr:M28 family peptidase [Leptolyngbya sp. NIES-2104]GAP99309.1 putative aminopeptidase [Leptolyngbya sp. NIES-2104]